jgi:hypothetical protein
MTHRLLFGVFSPLTQSIEVLITIYHDSMLLCAKSIITQFKSDTPLELNNPSFCRHIDGEAGRKAVALTRLHPEQMQFLTMTMSNLRH